MKNLLASAFVLVSVFSHAQQILNGNFENWTMQTLYEDPNGYLSTNGWTYPSLPGGNVIKTTSSYHAQFACQLTTIQAAADTMFGGLFIGTPGNKTINGGIPYTGQPDSVSAYMKFNIQPGDTAIFIVGFKNSGSIIAMGVQMFTGVQNTYKRISFPTNLTSAPDSMIAIISSSRLDPPRMPGSSLTIDSITFIGSTQTFPNPDFENWTPLTVEEPDNWTTINFGKTSIPSATKSANSYSGAYALRLETIQTSWGDTAGFIMKGTFGQNGPTGGMQVFSNPSKITGYYEYFPVGNDTAFGSAFSFINSMRVDSSFIPFTAKSTYTYFEIPLNYSGWPYVDTLNIIFSSSVITKSNVNLGSVLYIDSLNILYLPTGISENENYLKQSVYPNPFSNTAIISLQGIQEKTVDCYIYDLIGNVVMKKENITSNAVVINRNNLPAGMYQYRISLRNTSTVIAAGKLMIK